MAVWAVLAGLFLMHGAASPAVGCCDGTPVTAMTAAGMLGVPAAATGSAGHPGAVQAPAGPQLAAWHAAAASAVAASPAAASPARGGMLCSARQPRDASPSAILVADVAVCAMTAAACPAAVSPRAARPPGKPGLPLPLFLGVSRT